MSNTLEKVKALIDARPEVLTETLQQHFKNLNDHGVSVLLMHSHTERAKKDE